MKKNHIVNNVVIVAVNILTSPLLFFIKVVIKKRLFDPNRKTRLKMLAKQFGISEMQLHRIKTGENWGHIKNNQFNDIDT